MFRFTLGGVAAALGLVGAVQAQPAVPISTKAARPAFVPVRTAADPIQQVQQVQPGADVKAVPAKPAVTVPATPAVPIAPTNPATCPSYVSDVAAACGEPCGAACDCLCGPPGRVWFGAEYLLWTTKGNSIPPLVTTNLPGDTARATAGTLPASPVLIGGRNYNTDWRSGFRVYGGVWLNARQTIGVDGNYFYLGNSTTHETVASDGSQILTRPFTNNVLNGAQVAPFQDTQLVSFPGTISGRTTVDTKSEFTGAGVNGLLNLCCNPCGRLDLFVGYRYLNLNDTLTVREDLQTLTAPPTQFTVIDRFRTENHFHGVNMGLAWERRAGSFFLNLRGSVALGNTHTIVDIDGATTRTVDGVSTTSTGGLLAQPSNIGRYTLNRFAVVPEVTARIGVQLTDRVRVYAGYNFIYWSNVVRTGDVIDPRVNGSQIPTFPRGATTGDLFPRFEPRYTDFWAHGVLFGVQMRF